MKPGKATHGIETCTWQPKFPSCTQAWRSSLAKTKKMRKDFKFFVYELIGQDKLIWVYIAFNFYALPEN